MKIILHSDQSIEKTSSLDAQILPSLSGKRNPSIGYIPSTPDPRRKYFKEKEIYYKNIGFKNIQYWDPEENPSLKETESFWNLDIIHLSGGEVTPFMQRIIKYKIDSYLISHIEKGKTILGLSAGAMILSSSFKVIHYFKEKGDTQGLHFFPFEIFPHREEHLHSLKSLALFAQKNKIQICALDDGEILVLNGKKIKAYGNPLLISSEGKTESWPSLMKI